MTVMTITFSIQKSKATLKLKDLMVHLNDYGTLTVEELKKTRNLTVLCSSVSMESFVLPCQAVVSKDGSDLINTGDFLQYCVPTPSYNEVSYCFCVRHHT